ncbi:MAG TPA: nitroreductase family protein [Methanomassiliicoccaceae archaeon]|jgi:nitroreductase|nr:nitroreductase [Euryarchaeota archaeon]HOB37776.1 nitroreductase family protein [Methanomassiliicoccaceae archaeon]HOL08078.1 nitroreductase family protein [Methanomassiliicoccaceae archaeon]HOQ25393.1 nitroreductase family protein [Methanomassiliicoccaceae archaeon]HPT74055.1 nitroreductase family protein [Methanomassiliicoccaceae archaeon]
MEVMTAIRGRRSIRKYRPREIPTEVLEEVLEAGRLAPSAGNRQAWELIIVTDKGTLGELVPACKNQQFVGECSAFLAAVEVPGQRWSMTDLTIMMDHLTLAAHEKGLGTCWIGAFDKDAIGKLLGVPPDRSVAVCMTLGYPDEDPSPRSRKSPQELYHWERYGQRK